MVDVKEIKILNFGTNSYAVEDMSVEIQQLVKYFNIANRREAEVVAKYEEELTLIRAARDSIFRQIHDQFFNEQKKAQEVAAQEAGELNAGGSDSEIGDDQSGQTTVS